MALQAYTQNYDWVNLGWTSKASAYARVATPIFEIDEEKPYEEVGRRLLLWITPPRSVGIFRLTPKPRDADNLPVSLTWGFGVQHSVKPKSLLSSMTAEYSRV